MAWWRFLKASIDFHTSTAQNGDNHHTASCPLLSVRHATSVNSGKTEAVSLPDPDRLRKANGFGSRSEQLTAQCSETGTTCIG